MTSTTLRPDGPAGGPQDWAVEARGVIKTFGDHTALDDVDMLVPRGVTFGCLGPNGAGKTTLIRTLLGLTHADAGTVSLLGLPMPAARSEALARVGAIVDEPRFHGHLSGRQNLEILAAARGDGAHDRIAAVLERVGLGGRSEDRVSTYSMGMRQRLGVSACLLGDPELIMLDEPMNGLDPAGMQEMRSMILQLRGEGRTVVLSSHLLDEVERTCDAVAIVDRGKVIRQGSIETLTAGTAVTAEIDCSDPGRAEELLAPVFPAAVRRSADGVSISLPPGAGRDAVADINRRLVESGVAVYRLVQLRPSLEEWFLSVTSRLGEPS